MKITITRQGKTETLTLPEGSQVKSLLRQLTVNPETVLVARNREIVLESQKLEDGDQIEFIRVISGG